MHNFGAGDLIELRLADRRDTVMLPFTEAAVPQIDVAGGRMVVELPDGMLADDDTATPADERG